MLKIVKSLYQMKFSELMGVYSEGNQENGAELYPNLTAEEQVREAELDFYNYLSEVFFRIENAFYAILEENNTYLSALRMEPYKDGWLLCALETAPAARRRGYATALIVLVLRYLSQFGETKIYSHVSKKNIPSLSAHRKCGFSIELDYAVYSDGSVLQNNHTLVYHLKKSET